MVIDEATFLLPFPYIHLHLNLRPYQHSYHFIPVILDPYLWSTSCHGQCPLAAYKHADGKKIDGRRVLVDVERGRTVKGWLPRRLGGGLGGTRRGGPDVNIKHSGREDNERERERYRAERERETREGRGPVERDRERRRSRSRDRDKKRRGSRSRSRDRKRSRRSRDRRDPSLVGDGLDDSIASGVDEPGMPHRSRGERDRGGDRDRDRDRDRKRDRSRRTDSRGDRDRGDRKKDRRDKDRDRDRDKDRRDRDYERPEEPEIRIKQEPPDDYPDYPGPNYGDEGNYGDAPIKYERDAGDNFGVEEGVRREDRGGMVEGGR
ncbi:hypothetical protein J437_LFUL004316, partial [Ladona fulva]